jgi:cyclopropane fatty-acyl-phospholipid synthase-like methyltransferase
MNKPYSESCDQNKDPILSVISPVFSSLSSVLEIGSGTGQHAIYFAEKMPHLKWYTSDCQPYLEGINMWLDEAALSNTVAPVELDVTVSSWPELDVDAVFTANTLHIMSWNEVLHFMSGVGRLLGKRGSLLIYGPFNYGGTYTSDSNERFDQWLKSRDPKSGIKNFEDIVSLANDNHMELVTDYTMPANNRILHFRVPAKR